MFVGNRSYDSPNQPWIGNRDHSRFDLRIWSFDDLDQPRAAWSQTAACEVVIQKTLNVNRLPRTFRKTCTSGKVRSQSYANPCRKQLADSVL